MGARVIATVGKKITELTPSRGFAAELAAASTVVHALLEDPNVDPKRVSVEGHADSQPLVPNDSAENRAQNRRVELVIQRGSDTSSDEVLNFQ